MASGPRCLGAPVNHSTALISIRLQPSEWLSAWRQETGRLHLPVTSAPRPGQAIALRVQLSGQPVGATFTGSVRGVERQQSHHRIEVAPDAESLRAVGLLTAAARGEPVRFRERPLRFLARLPVVVTSNRTTHFMTATSISEGGCSLRWSGLLPSVGQALELRFGIGSRTADLRGVVRWRRLAPSSPAVGVRFGPKGVAAGAWACLLAEAVKAGAPGV